MSSIPLSKRAQNTPASPIRKLTPYAQKAKTAGTKVYHLNIGQPDIKSPKEFFEGIAQFKNDILEYDLSQGNTYLCESWSRYFNKTVNLKTTPEHFLITNGGSEAILFMFMACCDPGEEVIIFDPTYTNYIGFAAMAGIKLVPVASSIETNFALPAKKDIEAKITAKTRAIMFCSPNNPTGTIYTREEQQCLIDICNEHNLYLLADETYRDFVYDGNQPFSIFHLDPDNDKIVILDSLSKRFSLCGARLGCLITKNSELWQTCLRFGQARLACPTLEQVAAAYMMDHISDDFIQNVKKEYELRRDTLYTALKTIPKVTAHKPQGAFYTLVKLPVKNAEDFATWLLDKFSYNNATTFVAPAAGFYMEKGKGLDEVRIAYVLNSEDIKKAVEIILRGLEKYQIEKVG